MSASFAFDAPLPPSNFRGRRTAIDGVLERLLNAAVASSSLVAGPGYGKTSLLRFLASAEAGPLFAPRPSLRVYFDAQGLGRKSTDQQFWGGALRELKACSGTEAERAVLDAKIRRAADQKLDEFDLQDVFDAFGKRKLPIVMLVDNFDGPLRNDYFWNESVFFHHVRLLAQREPRGVAFVVATTRPLVDYWRPGAASPFMNIFLNQPLGPMRPEDLAERVTLVLTETGHSDDGGHILAAVQEHAAGHPLVANFVLDACLRLPRKGGVINRDALTLALVDPAGPMVTLVQRIRAELLPKEREALTALEGGNRLSPGQLGALRRLAEYGLLPPATVIPGEADA
jgi:hypothetical protein